MPALAWFRPAPRPGTSVIDDTAALVHELRPSFHVDFYSAVDAHDFVWRHARRPYDLCVYELADTPAHAFIWPYLCHYPGVVRLRSPALDRTRGGAAAHTGRRSAREFATEVRFTGRDMLAAPLLASRLVVVSDDHLAMRIGQDHPAAAVRLVPLGIATAETPVGRHNGTVRFGAAASGGPDLIARAAQRARTAGARFELVRSDRPEEVLRDADVVLALEWPPAAGEPPLLALAAMARGRAVVVLETEGTARWPALDPQTWQSRALVAQGAPLVVSLDARDEEHSLMLVMRRLAADPMLVDRLAGAGHAWWREHATITHAAAGWRRALEDAMSLIPPPRPAAWPQHLAADGTQHARRVLEEMQVEVDFLR
jgi:hypothetical protein